MSALLPNLLHFSRLLRAAGIDVQAVRTLDVAHAIDHIDIGRKREFYHALRCLLVHRPQDLPLFDEAFRVFWRPPPGEWTTGDLRAMGEQRRTGDPEFESPAAAPSDRTVPPVVPPLEVDQVAPLSYSDREAVRHKDFAELNENELDEARRLMADFRWDLGMRRTRRWRAGRGPGLDLRRVVRRAVTHSGELVDLPRREHKHRRRPLVLLCDVSGSMERYSRMLLHFLYCMSGRLDHVEVFVFATRLTRVTRHLGRRQRQHSVSQVLPRLARQVPDFAGGTRIGDVLRTFNRRWGRRVLGHGAVVLVISDGWDRGDPEQLGAEMARLQRTTHRLVWLNPLLGSPDYVPLTRGIQAALPFIDDFLPVHNLESLEQLGQHLNRLPARKGLYAVPACNSPPPTPSTLPDRSSGTY